MGSLPVKGNVSRNKIYYLLDYWRIIGLWLQTTYIGIHF